MIGIPPPRLAGTEPGARKPSRHKKRAKPRWPRPSSWLSNRLGHQRLALPPGLQGQTSGREFLLLLPPTQGDGAHEGGAEQPGGGGDGDDLANKVLAIGARQAL